MLIYLLLVKFLILFDLIIFQKLGLDWAKLSDSKTWSVLQIKHFDNNDFIKVIFLFTCFPFYVFIRLITSWSKPLGFEQELRNWKSRKLVKYILECVGLYFFLYLMFVESDERKKAIGFSEERNSRFEWSDQWYERWFTNTGHVWQWCIW